MGDFDGGLTWADAGTDDSESDKLGLTVMGLWPLEKEKH